jgi:molecular chaperone GrpE
MIEDKEEGKVEEGGAPGVGDPPPAADQVLLSRADHEDLRKRAEERDALRNEVLRAKADLDNFQKRMRKERPAWEDLAVRRFLRDLLPVIDNLERALDHVRPDGSVPGRTAGLAEGVRMTYQLLQSVLKDHGVEEIQARGEVFNPELHEAVGEVEVADLEAGRVAEVLEKGYRHRDAVLRPSRVNVARGLEDAKQPVDSSVPRGTEDPGKS